jgi:hypothetical protein
MLKKLAIALVAASVFAAPVLAQTGSTGSQAPAVKSTTAASAKAATPSVKKIRHARKHVRRGSHGKVAGIHGKHRAVIKTSRHVKGNRVVAQKAGQNGVSAIR